MQNARTFSDPEAYQSAIVDFETRMVPFSAGPYCARHSHTSVGGVRLQQGYNRQTTVAHLRHATNGLTVGFCPIGTTAQFVDGAQLPSNIVAVSAPGAEAHFRQEAGETWAAVTVTRERLAAVLRALSGRDAPSMLAAVQPDHAALQHLRHLFAISIALPDHAAVAPFGRPACPTETDLLEAVAQCLAFADPAPERAAIRRQREVMSRFREFIENHGAEPLQISDLCSHIGVGERTFRGFCEEALGMGPMRYLRLHRFMRVRSDLASGRELSVTAVAIRHGFFEFGRFAGDYGRLFGELPSVTLKSAHRRA